MELIQPKYADSKTLQVNAVILQTQNGIHTLLINLLVVPLSFSETLVLR